MNIEYKYWEYVMEHHPESYISKDYMIRNWEEGKFFDEFAESIGMTEEQLLEVI